MKTISNWVDLEPFGIVLLTAESGGLSYRYLCDVTARGRSILQKMLGVPDLCLSAPWNRGTEADPHVGSILLTPCLFVPVTVFALLESGYTEVWLYRGDNLLGIEPSDSPEKIALSDKMVPEALLRKFAYQGTAGDRNIHRMSGRIE
jgi:hypothetical protein